MVTKPMEGGTDFDLVVLGSGAAGLSAAVTASLAGARVLVIEKSEWLGGTSALSGGEIWVPMSQQSRRAGIVDDMEAVERYLRALLGANYDAIRTPAFLSAAPQALAELEAGSHLRYELMPMSADYHSALPGASPGGRSLAAVPFDGRALGPWFDRLRPPLRNALMFGGVSVCTVLDVPHLIAAGRSLGSALYAARMITAGWRDRLSGHARGTRLTNGNALVGRLLCTLRDRDVPVWTQCEVTGLHLNQGQVCGLDVRLHDRTLRIQARRGVVLATGGFSGSLPCKRQHFKHVNAGWAHHSLPPQTNTGDGAALAATQGARLPELGTAPAAWAPVSLLPKRHGELAPYPHFSDRGKPGIIAVDPQGERFVNESDSYHVFVAAMLARGVKRAWLVADHRAIRRYGLGAVRPFPTPLGSYLRSGYLLRGRDLAELAGRMGVDASRLERTVQDFNQGALRGEDPAFQRGASLFNRRCGDSNHQPNPALAALQAAPFYALAVEPGDIGTFLGLRTDANARVLDAGGQPVAGLYAAGNDALSLFGGHYPSAGITLGPALTFGWLAARHALANTSAHVSSELSSHDNSLPTTHTA